MTLGGLAAAIGLVIDDAIVVVETLFRIETADDSRTSGSPCTARNCRASCRINHYTRCRLPAARLSHGRDRSFFRALAITMTVALLTSLLLAVTWTPALSLVFLRERRSGSDKTHGDETQR